MEVLVAVVVVVVVASTSCCGCGVDSVVVGGVWLNEIMRDAMRPMFTFRWGFQTKK